MSDVEVSILFIISLPVSLEISGRDALFEEKETRGVVVMPKPLPWSDGLIVDMIRQSLSHKRHPLSRRWRTSVGLAFFKIEVKGIHLTIDSATTASFDLLEPSQFFNLPL